MIDKTTLTLNLVRDALSHYTETPPAEILPDTALADIGIDSLTLAELLFELEDRLGTTISETTALPQKISDVIELISPYIDGQAIQSAA